MNALELAADLESVGVYTDAAAMLRRQHEAIVRLREALQEIERCYGAGYYMGEVAKRVLAYTEEIAK